MQLITLISDWNSSDYYIGAIKGRILSSCPTVTIVDVNHQITSYNITQAAFVVKNTYKNFPKGTIHILSINSEASKEKPHVLVRYDGHYFIGTDNGMFHLFIEGKTESIIEIDTEAVESSFPELDVFAKVACQIIKKEDITKIGKKRKSLLKQLPVLPAIEESLIIGKVIYIDSFYNVITNVSKELFEQVRKKRTFNIYVQSKSNKISKINKKYAETSLGELLAIFNSTGHLEIAIRNGKAAQLFNLTTNSSIRIVFDDNKNSENDLQGRLF